MDTDLPTVAVSADCQVILKSHYVIPRELDKPYSSLNALFYKTATTFLSVESSYRFQTVRVLGLAAR
jgi:hypothetical protein